MTDDRPVVVDLYCKAGGNPNADSLRRVILAVPEQYVMDAGLTWAVEPSFDDRAPVTRRYGPDDPVATAATAYQRLRRNELRICMDVAWWERLIERTGKAERWECLDREGRWRRYWRRHGSLPRWAKP